MKPTTSDLIRRCFLVGLESDHEYERLPWDLCCDLVRFGLDDDPEDPDDEPGDGWGILALHLGVGDWGVKFRSRLAPTIGADPASYGWNGVRAKSGKHYHDGTRHAPYGGLSIAHLDSGALLDVYEEWDRPNFVLAPGGKPIPFDTLRRRGGKIWEAWLDHFTLLFKGDCLAVEDGGAPPFAEWVVRYWLREFWRPAWEAAFDGFFTRFCDGACDKDDVGGCAGHDDWPAIAESASVGARFRNSAKGAAKPHLGKPGDEIADAYIAYKLESRGENAAQRALRQVNYARRVAVVVQAAMIEVP